MPSPYDDVKVSAEDHAQAIRFGLSDGYWAGLDAKSRALYQKVRPLRVAAYQVDHFFHHVETVLERLDNDAKEAGGRLCLNPDFQRGHVWDTPRQIAYLENVLRKVAPINLKFNCAGWDGRSTGDLKAADVVCVDGLQRLTAIRRFMSQEIRVFDLTADGFKGTPFDPKRFRFTLEMFNIGSRADLLQFYLDLNRGGVVHADDEIERVEGLLQKALIGA